MTLLWILMAVVYVACWVYLGLATFRQGHYWLFWIGFIFPILWIIGRSSPRPNPRRRSGRVDGAPRKVASPLGLYADDFGVETGRHHGDFPHGFSHLAAFEAAGRIILADRLAEIIG